MQVTLLTQEHCAFCQEAKALLERLAREYELSISTLSVNTQAGEELAIQTGLLFPPGIVLDGELISYGRPSPGHLRRALERLRREKRGTEQSL